jgi:hypothetical protein
MAQSQLTPMLARGHRKRTWTRIVKPEKAREELLAL